MNGIRNILGELRYALFLSVHPFRGFWELKHEKRGSLLSGLLILAATVLANVASGLYSGWLFRPDGGVSFDIPRSVFSTLAVFFLWCIANWCLTCLFDGEGSLRDIVRASGYALLPLAATQLLLIPVSLALSLREAAFVSLLSAVGVVWCAFLLFSSVLVTHQYTFFKTLAMILFVLLGMAALAYVALLFFNLIQQVSGFIYVLLTEMRTRF